MDSKITVTRAIGKLVLSDVLRIISIVVGGILALLFCVAVWLTVSVSSWWGILLFFVVICILLIITIRQLLLWGLKQLYPTKLTKEQRDVSRDFIDKLQAVTATQSIGWPGLVAKTATEVIRHRDVSTLKKLIADSSTLKDDFRELERLITGK